VASFIGSPPMNLLPARIEGARVVFEDGASVPVPERLTNFVADGQEVIFGIRPDDLSPIGHGIHEARETTEIDLEVELAELLGTETLIYTTLAGQEIQGKMFDPRDIRPGERLTFRLSLDKAHVFDAGTGQSVRPH